MGALVAKFRREKSTFQLLEKLDTEINAIEQYGRNTENTRKRIVLRFLILAFLAYFLLILALYYCFVDGSPIEKFYWLAASVSMPFLIWLIKKVLTFYFSRKLQKNEKKLVSLKEKKRKMLENVMETETYKVAKTILEKFGNGIESKPSITTVATVLKPRPSLTSNIPGSARPELRQRVPTLAVPVPRTRLSFSEAMTESPASHNRSVATLRPNPTSQVSLPRTILSKDRSVLEKMVDYLVGDGPSNRYALICKNCSCHNGMALKEEFEYLSFKCCYCSSFNPSLKKRPSAPRLQIEQPSETQGMLQDDDDTSDSEKKSSDSEPIVELMDTEPAVSEEPKDENCKKETTNKESGLKPNERLNPFESDSD